MYRLNVVMTKSDAATLISSLWENCCTSAFDVIIIAPQSKSFRVTILLLRLHPLSDLLISETSIDPKMRFLLGFRIFILDGRFFVNKTLKFCPSGWWKFAPFLLIGSVYTGSLCSIYYHDVTFGTSHIILVLFVPALIAAWVVTRIHFWIYERSDTSRSD